MSKKGVPMFLILGMFVAAICSGIVATLFFFLTPTWVVSALYMFENEPAVSLESFPSDDGFSNGMFMGIIPIVSVFCLIVGSIFLKVNGQSGIVKYRSGAVTGAICFSVPSVLLGLIMAMITAEGRGEAIFMVCGISFLSALTGAVGAITFLAVVNLFDIENRLLLRLRNTKEASIKLTNAGPPQ
jgi:hypothetical protein